MVTRAEELRVALLTNFVAPYRVALFEALASRLRHLRVFVSTPMEPDRAWSVQHGALDVTVQRTVTLRRRHRRPGGISQHLFIHLPLDTLPRLSWFAPDVVISGEMGARTLQAALYRRLCRRSRLIVWATLSEHTEKDWGRWRLALRRVILRTADAVIVNGQSGARYIEMVAPGTAAQVVNQALSTARFAATPLARAAGAARRLVYSGRLIAQKGVFELQRALVARAERHPWQNVEITWAGDGAARAALEAAVLPANLCQCFTGHLDYEALAALYAASGALVLPTLFDEWGLVVNEALASGLPVLGSVLSQAVEELVRDGVTGWLFDPTRPESLERALDCFLDAPEASLAAVRGAARRRGLAVTVADATDRITALVEQVFRGDARTS